MERGQAVRFALELGAYATREASEGLDPDPPVLVAPRARDLAVHEEGRERVRRFRVEDALRGTASGRISVRRAWTSSVASHVGRNRTGAGVSGSGSGARGRSRSSLPASSRNRRSCIRSSTGASRFGAIFDQLAMSFGAAGPERAEVAARQVLDAVVLARLERADPLRREPVGVRAALLPRAARRHAHQVDPVPDSNAERRRAPCARSSARAGAEPALEQPQRPPGRRCACRRAGATPGLSAGSPRRRAGSRAARRGGSSRASASPGSRFAARAPASGRRARTPRRTTRAGCTRSARTGSGSRRSARAPAGSAGSRARGAAAGRGAPGSAPAPSGLARSRSATVPDHLFHRVGIDHLPVGAVRCRTR